jgi:hypothetical protein
MIKNQVYHICKGTHSLKMENDQDGGVDVSILGCREDS